VSRLQGYWYPKNSSARESAELGLLNGVCSLYLDGKEASEVGALDRLIFSDRVGNISRKITLPDGSLFETTDNDAIDEVLATTSHQNAKIGILHKLETHWGWIATSLVLTVVLSFAFLKWGLPWGAKQLAYAMPVEVTEKIGIGTLGILDDIIFDETGLSEKKQKEQRDHFQEIAAQLDTSDFTLKLHFRDMHDLPNAMALPSGDIIITDKLVEMADNQQEIDAVLLHEIGHVLHKHGLQQVVQSTFITVLVASITGGASGSNDLLVGMPTFLLQSQYSRDHETDADDFAFEQMLQIGIDPKYFATIMERMMEEVGETVETVKEKGGKDKKDSGVSNSVDDASDYFSSHPVTSDRIKRALEFSKKFNAQ